MANTHFGTMMFHILAKTSYRDADRYRIGETIFGVKVWSHEKIQSNEQLAFLEFGGYRKEAAEFGKRRGSDNISQAFSGFWFYGAKADELLYRVAQGEPVRLVFKNALGETVVDTEFAGRRRDRIPAWTEAFRACVVANRE
ncbi:MAG: hypothetical protein AAGA68_23015 [Pseudomonadota bacterium]